MITYWEFTAPIHYLQTNFIWRISLNRISNLYHSLRILICRNGSEKLKKFWIYTMLHKIHVWVLLFFICNLRAETEARQTIKSIMQLAFLPMVACGNSAEFRLTLNFGVSHRLCLRKRSVWRERKKSAVAGGNILKGLKGGPHFIARVFPTKEVVYPYTTRRRWSAHQSTKKRTSRGKKLAFIPTPNLYHKITKRLEHLFDN